MTTIHIISHTHWDREWYQPFQRFRLKLVHLIDGLLDLMETDPSYQFFMLDGQTIVLEDYLQMRPYNEARLRRLIEGGRLLIGPWHILPDEFLVSPESTIRNLLEGSRTASRFGAKMQVGYIPDPFGHLAQMPQILKGFGIETASLQRGLDDQPCEFWWEAPDGSRVWTAYLRDGYGSASNLSTGDPQAFTAGVAQLRDSLLPYTCSTHVLLMFGNDHTEPPINTSSLIAYANDHLPDCRVTHSTLPAFIAAVKEERLSAQVPTKSSPPSNLSSNIPTIFGELRSSKRHSLLPGVLSSRMWIKQRNHACETLLEKWAEPYCAISTFLHDHHHHRDHNELSEATSLPPNRKDLETSTRDRLGDPHSILLYAWRLLMECHPHDSICGCSIDQVHAEMRPRFDGVEQIGEELTRQSLESIAARINTCYPDQPGEPEISPDPRQLARSKASSAICVFNPTAGPRTELVNVLLQLAGDIQDLEIYDSDGIIAPHQVVGAETWEIASLNLDLAGLQALLANLGGQAPGGAPFLNGLSIQAVDLTPQGTELHIHAALGEAGKTLEDAWMASMPEFINLLASGAFSRFRIRADLTRTRVEFLAREVPGHGYKTYWTREAVASQQETASQPEDNHAKIENEYFSVEVSGQDGSLTLTDLHSGAVYTRLNYFLDGGDCGDEYNYAPPDRDTLVSARLLGAQVRRTPTRQILDISLSMLTPIELSPDRRSRSHEMVEIPIHTCLSLAPGVPRLDIETSIDNRARDHRLRVHFPYPFSASYADYDGHFFINRRPVGTPPFDESWAELPCPTVPQRAFCLVSGVSRGLILANRGLPEVEVKSPALEGTGDLKGERAEIALTLLRSVGWLSRDDFPGRKNHAGPGLPTPEAQVPGRWDFSYALIPFSTGRDPGSTAVPSRVSEPVASILQAYAFNVPLRAVEASLHSGTLFHSRSLVEVKPASFVLSAIKIAEDSSGLIVRGWNLSGEPLQVWLATPLKFSRAARLNLAEEVLGELPVAEDGSVTFETGSYAISTVKFW